MCKLRSCLLVNPKMQIVLRNINYTVGFPGIILICFLIDRFKFLAIITRNSMFGKTLAHSKYMFIRL